MFRRILTIGDIHGKLDKFLSLYEQLDFDSEQDLLIFLGDYIDRGEKSFETLAWMYGHRHEKNIIMLRGNHEQMMLDFYDSDGHDYVWLPNGGDITAASLMVLDDELREKYIAFVRSLPLQFRISADGKDFFFCHAGVNPLQPLDEQSPDDLLWIREKFFDHYQGKTIVVVGHTPVLYFGQTRPLIEDNMIMVDTGSYIPGGRISCVDVLSGKVWQSKI